MTPQGKIVEGTRRPTSDLDAILYIFEKFLVNATIHTPPATPRRWAWCRTVFPAHAGVPDRCLRGDVPVAPFTPSSDKGMAF